MIISNDFLLPNMRIYNNRKIAPSPVAGQLHSPNGDSDNSNGSQRAVAVTRSEVEQQQQQQQQPHRQRQQQRQATATVPVLACTNQSSITTTTTAFTVASSMLLLQTQVSNGLPTLGFLAPHVLTLIHFAIYSTFNRLMKFERGICSLTQETLRKVIEL